MIKTFFSVFIFFAFFFSCFLCSNCHAKQIKDIDQKNILGGVEKTENYCIEYEISTSTEKCIRYATKEYVKFSYVSDVLVAKEKNEILRTSNAYVIDNGHEKRAFIYNTPKFYFSEGNWKKIKTGTSTISEYTIKTSEKEKLLNKILGIISVNATTTEDIYSNWNEAFMQSYDASWTTARNRDVADDFQDLNDVQLLSGSDYYSIPLYYVLRGFLSFNTDIIPDEAIITSAKIRLYGSTHIYAGTNPDGYDYLTIVPSNLDDPYRITPDDFDNYIATAMTDEVYSIDWNLTGYNDFTLNDYGISQINKTGQTQITVLEGHDFENQTPTVKNIFAIHYAYESGTNYDPYIEVNYYMPATTTNDRIDIVYKYTDGDYTEYYIPAITYLFIFLLIVFLICLFIVIVKRNKK